jgi:hypothetical protein
MGNDEAIGGGRRDGEYAPRHKKLEFKNVQSKDGSDNWGEIWGQNHNG